MVNLSQNMNDCMLHVASDIQLPGITPYILRIAIKHVNVPLLPAGTQNREILQFYFLYEHYTNCTLLFYAILTAPV